MLHHCDPKGITMHEEVNSTAVTIKTHDNEITNIDVPLIPNPMPSKIAWRGMNQTFVHQFVFQRSPSKQPPTKRLPQHLHPKWHAT
jgi:hypothetical protein